MKTKWTYPSRQAAEDAAKTIAEQRDCEAVLAQALYMGKVEWLDEKYGHGDNTYRFGVIHRRHLSYVVVAHHNDRQSPSLTIGTDSWAREVMNKMRQTCMVDDPEGRSYREGMSQALAAINTYYSNLKVAA